jgi:hypothetical protein
MSAAAAFVSLLTDAPASHRDSGIAFTARRRQSLDLRVRKPFPIGCRTAWLFTI